MCSLRLREQSPAHSPSMNQNAKSSRPGTGEVAVVDHRLGQTAAGVGGIVEGEKRAAAGCAGVEVEGRSHSSEAAGMDAMGAADAGLEEDLLMSGRCRSAEHGSLAGAGQSCYMFLVEQCRQERGEVHHLALTAAGEEVAYGSGSGFPTPACFQSSARPGDL